MRYLLVGFIMSLGLSGCGEGTPDRCEYWVVSIYKDGHGAETRTDRHNLEGPGTALQYASSLSTHNLVFVSIDRVGSNCR